MAWALRLYRLDAQSFWYDEGYSTYIAAIPPAEALELSASDLIPPLHRYLLVLWLPLAGWTEFAARFLSVWTGTLIVAALVRFGADVHSRWAGLLTGFLATLSPFYVWHSQDARMYMPEALFCLLATLFLVQALRTPARRRLWVGFVLLDALALYTHMTAGFMVGFHLLLIVISGVRQRSLGIRGGLALAGVLLAWTPWLAFALPRLGQNTGYWPGRLNWRFVVSGAFQGFVTGQMLDGMEAQTALVVWGSASLIGILALLLLPINRGQRIVLFLGAYLIVPMVAMYWIFRNVPKFSPRHLIGASPALFLLIGTGLAALVRARGWYRGLGRVIAGALLAGLVATAGRGLCNLYFNPIFAKADFRTAARLVREQMAPGETVLIVPGHVFPVWQFYFGPEEWTPLPNDPLLDVTHVLHYRTTVEPLSQLLDGRSGVWLVEWEPWVVDPTGLVVHLLEQVGKEMPLPEKPAGLRLRHYRLDTSSLAGEGEGGLPLPPEPAVSPPLDSSLDLPLDLVGCALPQRVQGDEEIRVGCYWAAHDTLPHHLSVSARLLDTAGVEWGRADTAISGPHLVAGRWPLDEPVLGRYALRPFPGIPPGDFYRLELLVYQPDGTEHGTVAAGPVVVDRPSSPFTARSFSGSLSSSPVPAGRLGGLFLEAANVHPEQVLPGEEVQVEALWRVTAPFHEPSLVVEGSADETPLLPEPGATGVWEVGDRYRTISRVPVSPYTLGGLTTLWAVSEDGEIPVGMVRVDVTRTFTLPTGIQPMDYRLGDAISLAGTQLSVGASPLGTGEMTPTVCGRPELLRVVLYWRAEAFVDKSYTVFVHLVGPNGQIYAQADAPPRAGRHPTTHWLPGEVVADTYWLEQPAGTPSGEYRVLAGLYDLTTLDRLPVTDATGSPVPNDAILIGSWQVP